MKNIWFLNIKWLISSIHSCVVTSTVWGGDISAFWPKNHFSEKIGELFEGSWEEKNIFWEKKNVRLFALSPLWRFSSNSTTVVISIVLFIEALCLIVFVYFEISCSCRHSGAKEQHATNNIRPILKPQIDTIVILQKQPGELRNIRKHGRVIMWHFKAYLWGVSADSCIKCSTWRNNESILGLDYL